MKARAAFFILALLAASNAAAQPERDAEFRKLIPHVAEACGVVITTPSIFPFRAFPFGPLGLEVRKAPSGSEANDLRNFHLGLVGAACGISERELTAFFFCGPECPANRRAHLAGQVAAIRELAAAFEKRPALRMVAVWAPKGELRVNDLFVMSGKVRQAIPSPMLGFVPSGDWQPWPSLRAYLGTLQVAEDDVRALTEQMLAIGLSALMREGSATRLVGVGVGDNESGLILLRSDDGAPRVGRALSDGKICSIVERIAPDLYYYETK